MNSEKVKEIKDKLHEEIFIANSFGDKLRRVETKDLQDILTLINELEEYIEGNEQDAKAFVNGWHKDLETELKQFAERLKEMAYKSTDWSHGEHPLVVEVDYIDEVLEEFLNK